MTIKSHVRTVRLGGLAAILLILPGGCTMFHGERAPANASARPDSKLEATAQKAAEITTQPVRDIGVAKPEIPAALARATQNPYDAVSTRTCKDLRAAIAELNNHLGEDFILVAEKDENKAGKIAEAGGKTLVNAIIPFRGLVRELTGAAAAKRRYDDAIDAGYARRGFLRGVQKTKACRQAP